VCEFGTLKAATLRSLASACNNPTVPPAAASYAAEAVARLVVSASAQSPVDPEYISILLSFLSSLCAGYMKADVARCVLGCPPPPSP
jgi:hypothetical protein